jgi:hypothetical protein
MVESSSTSFRDVPMEKRASPGKLLVTNMKALVESSSASFRDIPVEKRASPGKFLV